MGMHEPDIRDVICPTCKEYHEIDAIGMTPEKYNSIECYGCWEKEYEAKWAFEMYSQDMEKYNLELF